MCLNKKATTLAVLLNEEIEETGGFVTYSIFLGV